MKATIDPNLYTQIGLDSGSLTILGSIVHSLGDPGEYRVALHHGETVECVNRLFEILHCRLREAGSAHRIGLIVRHVDKDENLCVRHVRRLPRRPRLSQSPS